MKSSSGKREDLPFFQELYRKDLSVFKIGRLPHLLEMIMNVSKKYRS
jgi:hypothetical protein